MEKSNALPRTFLSDYDDKLFGGGGKPSVAKKDMFVTPLGYAKKPKAFDGQCGILSITIGTLFNRAFMTSEKGDPLILKHLQNLHNSRNKIQQEKSYREMTFLKKP